jgi:hypothetical protein
MYQKRWMGFVNGFKFQGLENETGCCFSFSYVSMGNLKIRNKACFDNICHVDPNRELSYKFISFLLSESGLMELELHVA